MKTYILYAIAGLSLAFASCRSTTVVTADPPPAPVVVKVRPNAPSHRHVWINGHYIRRGHRYVWQEGYWTVPPSRGQRYVDGYWTKSRGSWVWVPGYWRR